MVYNIYLTHSTEYALLQLVYETECSLDHVELALTKCYTN